MRLQNLHLRPSVILTTGKSRFKASASSSSSHFPRNQNDVEQKVPKFWKEPYPEASLWGPCADKNVKRAGAVNKNTGFILVSANGGLNQERVAPWMSRAYDPCTERYSQFYFDLPEVQKAMHANVTWISYPSQ